jgi:hypothetical protein
MSILFHATYPVVLKSIQEEDGDEFSDRVIEDKSASERSSPRQDRANILLDLCTDIIREIQNEALNIQMDNELQFSFSKSSVRITESP